MTKRNPLKPAVIVAVVTAILNVLVAFSVPVSEEQQQAIIGLVSVAAPIVVGVLAHRLVKRQDNTE